MSFSSYFYTRLTVCFSCLKIYIFLNYPCKDNNNQAILNDNYLSQTNRMAMWVSKSGSNISDTADSLFYAST